MFKVIWMVCSEFFFVNKLLLFLDGGFLEMFVLFVFIVVINVYLV